MLQRFLTPAEENFIMDADYVPPPKAEPKGKKAIKAAAKAAKAAKAAPAVSLELPELSVEQKKVCIHYNASRYFG